MDLTDWVQQPTGGRNVAKMQAFHRELLTRLGIQTGSFPGNRSKMDTEAKCPVIPWQLCLGPVQKGRNALRRSARLSIGIES
jgi:hypothetical protein